MASYPQESLRDLVGSGRVVLDQEGRAAFVDGRRVELTPKECGYLEQLLKDDDAFDRDLDRVSDHNTDPSTSSARVTVITLRRKLLEPGLGDGRSGDREPRRPLPTRGTGGAAMTSEAEQPGHTATAGKPAAQE